MGSLRLVFYAYISEELDLTFVHEGGLTYGSTKVYRKPDTSYTLAAASIAGDRHSIVNNMASQRHPKSRGYLEEVEVVSYMFICLALHSILPCWIPRSLPVFSHSLPTLFHPPVSCFLRNSTLKSYLSWQSLSLPYP